MFFEDENDRYQYFPPQYVFGDDCYIPDEYMEEKWWYMDNNDPNYMISNYGRVYSTKTRRFVKPKKMDREGHLGVGLCRDGKRFYRYLHRLIAEVFIPNPHNYPIVRHLDDNKENNDIENLAWGTQKDNMRDAVRNGRNHRFTAEDREKNLEIQRIPIRAINLDTGEEIVFRSQSEAARELGIYQANIWKVLNGQRNKTCGYYFEYLEKRGV